MPRGINVRPESPAWWRTPRSLAEIAELIDQVVNEKCGAERRLSLLIRSHEQLQSRLNNVDAELAAERERFKKALTERIAKGPNVATGAGPGNGEGRLQVEMATRKRLMDQEIERRVRELQVEWKQERHRMRQEIVALEKELETYRLTAGDF